MQYRAVISVSSLPVVGAKMAFDDWNAEITVRKNHRTHMTQMKSNQILFAQNTSHLNTASGKSG